MDSRPQADYLPGQERRFNNLAVRSGTAARASEVETAARGCRQLVIFGMLRISQIPRGVAQLTLC